MRTSLATTIIQGNNYGNQSSSTSKIWPLIYCLYNSGGTTGLRLVLRRYGVIERAGLPVTFQTNLLLFLRQVLCNTDNRFYYHYALLNLSYCKGAGGIVGDHSKNGSRWSLEYQATVDQLDARVAMIDENITGLSLWQFCDIKVDQQNTSTGRPGGINNKGVVDEYRVPKLAASAVAAEYNSVSYLLAEQSF